MIRHPWSQVERDDSTGGVLDLAREIRAARAKVSQPIPVHPKPGQCQAFESWLQIGCPGR
jgi:hypothetical protein